VAVRTTRALVAVAVLTGVWIVPAARPAAASGPCSASATRVLAGAQPAFTSTLAAGERVDVGAATWAPSNTLPYPVYFDSTADSCWDGGRITGTFPVTTPWSVYHDTAGIGVSGSGVTIDHPRIFNVGDGIRIRDNADGFAIRHAYLSYIHDDCVEDDRLVNGTIDQSFLDGCYVGISTRRSDGTTYDGHLNTVRVTNSLVRLQAMPTVYSGAAAGSGGFFKWDTTTARTSPGLDISDSIFRADQKTNHQDLNLPAGYPVSCSNNVMVWLGTGPFPGSLPSCFTVTTDRSVWDRAVRTWETAHPGVVTGPEVAVGDASIVEGTTGSRTMHFPVSLSEPPGSGRTVTVYWSTAPGTATGGGTDFTTAKGKLTFTGSQVMKMISVGVKPDAKDEADEQLAVVLAGVDGGQDVRERGIGTIVDDDPGTGGLVVSDATVVEGDSGARSLVVPIAVSSPPGVDVLAHWLTVADTAGAGTDFVAKSGTVKIAAAARMATVSIPLVVDGTAEPTETFRIVVDSAPGVTIVDGTGVVTIRDDD
jgi:hypothetical protein